MRAVVLVGGEGTRLRPLTLDTPKQLLPVARMPMIAWVVRYLASHGVDDVVLSMGYRPDAFVAAYPDGTCEGVTLTYVVEPEPLDTAGAFRFAVAEAGIESTFLALNGDVLTDFDVASLRELHRSAGAMATIAVTPVDDPSRFGVVMIEDDGRVSGFVEKPRREDAPSNLINAGVYVLDPGLFATLPTGRRVSLEREVFPALVEAGALYAKACEGYWLDTGTPAAYLQANLDRLPEIEAIASSATIARDAVVTTSAIGANARVDTAARVEESVLLDGAVVEKGATVRRSIVGRDATVGESASLDRLTVVGTGVRIPAHASLSGARVPDCP